MRNMFEKLLLTLKMNMMIINLSRIVNNHQGDAAGDDIHIHLFNFIISVSKSI